MHPRTTAALSKFERTRRRARFQRQHLGNLLAWHGNGLGEEEVQLELTRLTWQEIDAIEAKRHLLAGTLPESYARVAHAQDVEGLRRLYETAPPRKAI